VEHLKAILLIYLTMFMSNILLVINFTDIKYIQTKYKKNTQKNNIYIYGRIT